MHVCSSHDIHFPLGIEILHEQCLEKSTICVSLHKTSDHHNNTFDDAHQACATHDKHLLHIYNQEEQVKHTAWISRVITDDSFRAWIGGRRSRDPTWYTFPDLEVYS